MKFAVATIFALAFAMGVQASWIPVASHAQIAGHGLSYTAVSSPVHAPAVWAPAVAAHIPAAVAVHESPAWHGHAGAVVVGAAHAGPALVVGAHGAHAVPVAVAAHHGHEGAYVAQTRGAVHAAPLAGHIASVSSVNVAPAPGTV